MTWQSPAKRPTTPPDDAPAMTPGARVQAAIEIVDEVARAARSGGAPADRLIADYFARRRYAGSGDKRAVRELAYAAIRRAGEVPHSGRAALLGLAEEQPELAELFTGEGHAPAVVETGEAGAGQGVAPGWLLKRLGTSEVNDVPALVGRAPLDVRINTLRWTMVEARDALPEAEPVDGLPNALRLPTGTSLPPALDGLVEVQDAGSQWVAICLDPQPGEAVLDLCAGAGGKTLGIAAAMEARGALLATDTDRGRLSQLLPRARMAGAGGLDTRLLDEGHELAALGDWRGQADAVLVDAPCSGTGTWRRNPEARWRASPERLARLAASQARLLRLGAALVRPGGRMTYAVCSVLDEEGPDAVARFLADQRDWTPAEPPPVLAGSARGPGVRLSPGTTGTDGFFVATLVRAC